MTLTVGVDVGAGTCKAAVMEDGERVVATALRPTGAFLEQASVEAFEAVLVEAGADRADVDYLAASGYGRYQFPGRDIQITEITCHGRGAHFLFPKTHCVLDVGAQNSRAIRVETGGKVRKFMMNNRCAAGAGRFLERVGKALEIDLMELGPLSLRSEDPQPISSICAVLAESEIINHVTLGKKPEDIAMGALYSIADRIVTLVRQVGVEEEVTLTGGVSGNAGMVKALEDRLGVKLNVSEQSTYAGAIGACILGHQRVQTRQAA